MRDGNTEKKKTIRKKGGTVEREKNNNCVDMRKDSWER
jgi:hypothetical protein